jgi:error-prone DNA polymerase
MTAARFTDDEADGLRRSMATFRHYGSVGVYGVKFVEGMIARGYDPEFAQRCFKQIEGFGSYGFPESHAISFALLVWASAWVKWARPDVFCCALLNSQPMGFYQPAQLVRDAREHGVEVRPPDVMWSDWDCTLEDPPPQGEHLRQRRLPVGPEHYRPLRLGLRQISGLKEGEARKLVAARRDGARTFEDFALRAGVARRTLELLAEADAFRSLGLDRRAALWAVKGFAGEINAEKDAPLLARGRPKEVQVELPFMSPAQHVAEDYRTTSLSLKAHPVGFFREELTRRRMVPCERLKTLRSGQRTAVGGLVLVRQRPGTAKGVVFLTLEDETGIANIVVWRDAFEANRRLVMGSAFLAVQGKLQIEGEVVHLVAEKFTDLSPWLSAMREAERPEGEAPAAGVRSRVSSRVSGRLIRSRDFH